MKRDLRWCGATADPAALTRTQKATMLAIWGGKLRIRGGAGGSQRRMFERLTRAGLVERALVDGDDGSKRWRTMLTEAGRKAIGVV